MEDPLRMHVQPDLGAAPLVLAFEGWNDAGEAATAALRYLERHVACAPLAEIDCGEFFDFTVRRPLLRLEGGRSRVIEWPDMRFSYGSLDNGEIVLGHGIEPHLRWKRFCDVVASLVARLRIDRVIMLGAYLADVLYSRPVDVTGFATRPELLDEIDVAVSSYQGPTGIVGVLADRLRRDGVEIVSLWAGLPHYIGVAPNPRGALALVHKLAACLEARIDDAPLRKEAAEFEERISALVASDPELHEYVKQLKRRDFAQ